ncbi:MAG: DHH family phosphoesterase, partial [Patescibacteria group bacterium]|nr:DHH family phosphoesterase [Patescibacteria group bacterium]
MEFSPKQQTTELIKKANKILIVGRTDFDVDTIGSMLALVSVLKSLEKEVTAVVSGEISEGYNFLPEITKLEKDIAGSKDTILKVNIEENPVNKLSYNVEEGHLNIIVTAKNKAYKDTDFIFEKGNYEYDLIIVLDTGDVDKIDKIYDKNTELFFEKPVINIDHHAGNEYFGTVNLVDITATSTAEILISIIEALGQNLLTEDVATNLLAGLIYDTGSFKNKNTTPKALKL